MDVMTGKEVRWDIQKGKAGIHEGARGRYFYDFSINTADFYDDLVTAGLQCGIVEGTTWLGIRDSENPAEFLIREQGKAKFVQKLVDDVNENNVAGTPKESLYNLIREEVIKRHGIDVRYDW